MKNVIVLAVCSFLFFYSSLASADREYFRGEIRAGWGYSQNNVDADIQNNDNVISLKFKRMGIDAGIGFAAAKKYIGFAYELYFHSDFYNFNEDGEADNTWFIFGLRFGLGPNIPMSSRHAEMYFMPCWSLLSMGVDTTNADINGTKIKLGPAWTPQVGLNVKVGVVYVRVIFYGIVAKDEKGYGFMVGTGGVYSSKNLND